jgi:cold shock CspA family protein
MTLGCRRGFGPPDRHDVESVRFDDPDEGEAAVAQGTVKDFDIGKRTGTLLMDDHSEVAIEPSSIPAGSEIRYLRIGQRVGFELSEDGDRKVATNLRVVTFGY